MASLLASYALKRGKNLYKKHGNTVKAALTEKAEELVNNAAKLAETAIKAKVGTLGTNLRKPPNNRKPNNRKPNNSYKPLPVGNNGSLTVNRPINFGNSPLVM
jgi:hypothetical protein